jgi:20S proteasome alpha/beta subunit
MLAELRHLDATIKLFDPDYDLRTIKGKRHYKKSHLFKQGECYRLVLDALRKACEPTDTATMTALVMKAKGLGAEQQPSAYSSVLTALNAARKNGIVMVADKQGASILWQMA